MSLSWTEFLNPAWQLGLGQIAKTATVYHVVPVRDYAEVMVRACLDHKITTIRVVDLIQDLAEILDAKRCRKWLYQVKSAME